jgi:prepilin-type processing-associated H-X9-DG protein
MAVLADRNPWIKAPGAEGKSADIYAQFNPDGGKEFVNYGNAITHQEHGQNVLYMDGHVAFEKQPFCGVNDDNIYTNFEGGDIRKGGYPVPNASEPAHRLDSYLVNDAEGGGAPLRKGRGCFPANTPVWVNGSMVEISKVGVSECLATSSIEKLEEHEGSFVCRDITLESGNNISVVDAHCFMLESGKWVAAQNLKNGMSLKTMNSTVVIKNIVTRTIPFVGKVYNLRISNSDRYIVGKDGVIVRDY